MDHPDLIGALEPSQLSATRQQPLPRRALGRGTVALLVLLRVYVLLAVPVIVYAFIHAMNSQH